MNVARNEKMSREGLDMDMNRNRNRRLLIIAVVFITFNLLVLIIPFRLNAVFWTAFFFSNITILAMIVTDWVAFRNVDTVKRAFMGMPIIKIAYSCLISQLVLCVGFMIAGSFLTIPAWRLAVPSILILAVGTISIFKADWGREVIEHIEEKHIINTEFMMNFRVSLDALIPKIADTSLKVKMESLAKTAKRSDPVSNDGLVELEGEMGRKVELLQYSISNNVMDDVNTLMDEISHLLNERNLKCRTLKRHQQ